MELIPFLFRILFLKEKKYVKRFRCPTSYSGTDYGFINTFNTSTKTTNKKKIIYNLMFIDLRDERIFYKINNYQ